LAATAKASVETPDPLTALGVNDAVAPAGIPLAARVTTPANPFNAATVTIALAEDPCVTLTEAGAADNMKSGGFTVSCTTTGYVKLPLEPKTVMR